MTDEEFTERLLELLHHIRRTGKHTHLLLKLNVPNKHTKTRYPWDERSVVYTQLEP